MRLLIIATAAICATPALAQSPVSDADLMTARHSCLGHMFVTDKSGVTPKKWPSGWEHFCESIEKEFNSRQAAQPPIPPDFSKRIANKIKGDAK